MNCFLLNECRHQNRCCNFCKIKRCSDRFTDDYAKCRYFESALFDMAMMEEPRISIVGDSHADTSKKGKR